MAIALYNPKYYMGSKGKVLNTADIKRFVWSHANWDLKVNEIKKFPDEVGRAMLRLFEFLIEVTPKNLVEIKNQQAEKKFQCDQCPFSTDTKVAFITHSRTKHGVGTEEAKQIDEIEEAQPSRVYQTPAPQRKMSIEEQEGVGAEGVKDKDGVAWYGAGVSEDSLN